MKIRIPYKITKGEGFREKEVKLIQEYTNFILVEHPEGYRECINKLDVIKRKNEEQPGREGNHKKYVL